MGQPTLFESKIVQATLRSIVCAHACFVTKSINFRTFYTGVSYPDLACFGFAAIPFSKLYILLDFTIAHSSKSCGSTTIADKTSLQAEASTVMNLLQCMIVQGNVLPSSSITVPAASIFAWKATLYESFQVPNGVETLRARGHNSTATWSNKDDSPCAIQREFPAAPQWNFRHGQWHGLASVRTGDTCMPHLRTYLPVPGQCKQNHASINCWHGLSKLDPIIGIKHAWTMNQHTSKLVLLCSLQRPIVLSPPARSPHPPQSLPPSNLLCRMWTLIVDDWGTSERRLNASMTSLYRL